LSAELSQDQDDLSNPAPTVARFDGLDEDDAPSTPDTIDPAEAVRARMSMNNFLCD
jgi:hypothetical protein